MRAVALLASTCVGLVLLLAGMALIGSALGEEACSSGSVYQQFDFWNDVRNSTDMFSPAAPFPNSTEHPEIDIVEVRSCAAATEVVGALRVRGVAAPWEHPRASPPVATLCPYHAGCFRVVDLCIG